jgi:hypothetical protein
VYLERRKPALLSFIEHRLGAALRGKLEPPDLFQELAVKALRELPQTNLEGKNPFGWLCHLAEQCIVDGHRHFAAGKRTSGREVTGNMPIGEGSQDLVALLAASMTTPTQAVEKRTRTAARRSDGDLAGGAPGGHAAEICRGFADEGCGGPTRKIGCGDSGTLDPSHPETSGTARR